MAIVAWKRQSRPVAWDLADYLGCGIGARRPGLLLSTCLGCPVQPDNFMETLLYLLYQVAGIAPMIPLVDQLAATVACSVRLCMKGCDRAGYYEQGDFADGL